MESLLRVTNLCKRFDTLSAIEGINFEIRPGEVVGLAGNIGSGKSVLVMLLAGLYGATEGEIFYKGERLSWPFDANKLGIGVIHQKPVMNDEMDVTSNIFLGNEIGWPGKLGLMRILDPSRMDREAERILSDLGVTVPSLREKVANLSGEKRLMIAIARVLIRPVRFVLIDEAANSLTFPFQQKLFNIIQEWRKQGVAVLFSSNNLDHLFAITDRIISLFYGHKIADVRTDETNRDAIIANLLGSGASDSIRSTILDLGNYDRIREQAESMRYYQMFLEKDLAAQNALNYQLIERLTDHVQALDRANQALQEAHRRLISESERERKILARELHDQVIQNLFSINYQLEGLEVEHHITDDLADDLSDVRTAIRENVSSLRQICGDLRPPTIDSLGLGAALQSFGHDWSERTNIELTLEIDKKLGRLSENIELSIFRIVQESLNNVWKHAHASSVRIKLMHTSPRMLLISIADNGMGIEEGIDITNLAEQGHYGLLGISERVALLGGRIRITRQLEGGADIQIEIPHPRIEAAALEK